VARERTNDHVTTRDPMTTQLQAMHAPMSDARPPRSGGVSEFFRYHGLWSPGVRLFRAIGFRAKALVISAVFLLPIGVLSYNYFTGQQGQIEFSAKERLGVTYARELMPLLKLLQQQRLLAVSGGDPASIEADLAKQLARVAAVEKDMGADLGTTKAHAALVAAVKQAAAAPREGDGAFAARSVPVTALLDLLGVSTDGSNLTLDPDIDTYYLMDAAMFRLPVMIEAVAQSRGAGAAVLSGGATPVALRTVVEQMTIMASNQVALEAGLAKAVAYNPAVAGAVKPEASHAVVQGYAKGLDATVLAAGGPQGEAKVHVAAANAALDAMHTLAQRATDQLDSLIAERVARLEGSRNTATVVLVISMVLAAYLFMSFRKVLEGGLREVEHHIDAMRQGDLTTTPRAWGADEAARLMGSLSQMQGSLRRIVSQVRGASDQMVSASGQINAGASDLSARTEQSAANLEETASAMEQITATVQRGEEAVQQASELAVDNARQAEAGGQIVAELVQTMQAINGSSARIGDIIGTIDGIAFQTNILALNAAVEAARAGEQGRGFAVVASEVRALAQRSAVAAREIKTLVGASLAQAEGGVQVVQRAGQAIDSIVNSARRVDQLLAEVRNGAREQSAGVAQSARAVQDLDSVTQQNAALVEQTAAAAGSLQQQAQGLAGEVAQFKLPAVA
jgi:methyl-accepting chemotaxis protein